MLPTNNSYYSSTFYPHRLSHCCPQVRDDRRGAGGETPPSKRNGGGASAARLYGPRPSPSPAMPELAPHPWDPVRVPATDAAAPLFLPPALSLIHPALYLLASIFVLLTLARNPASLLAAPPPPSPPRGDNNAADQRSVEATRDPSPEDVRPRATQSASLSSPLSRAGGGRGPEHSALSLPGLCSRLVGYYLRMVIPILVDGVCNIDQLPVGEVGKKVPIGLPPLLCFGSCLGWHWAEMERGERSCGCVV
jgi:hypothetical protein